MPDYEVIIKFDAEGSTTARGAAEGAYMNLMGDMFHGPLSLEVRNKRTGQIENIQLESDLENDVSLLRFMALMMVASDYMTKEQKEELQKWERENIDGETIGTSDWPGWEPLIGKKPKKFRTS